MQTKQPTAVLPEVRRVSGRAPALLADMLAHAYVADPVSRWLIPGDEQWTRFAPKYFAYLLHGAEPDGVLFAREDASAAALWRPPSEAHSGRPGRLGRALHALRLMSLLRVRSNRGVRLARLLEEAHPAEPHWFLQFVAVEASQRGRGLASEVVRPVLERCDREGQVAYLESSNPANTPVFQHFGFEVRGRIDLSPGPAILCMRREPRA